MATYIQTPDLESANKSFFVEHGNFCSFGHLKLNYLISKGAMWTVTQHAWTREGALETHHFSTPARLVTTKEVGVLIFLFHTFIFLQDFKQEVVLDRVWKNMIQRVNKKYIDIQRKKCTKKIKIN